MALFQQSVLKKYLSELDKDAVQKSWTVFTAHFHNPTIQQNILNAKEEEYQSGFVDDLFVKVLGYTLYPQPDYNFVLEKKTETDSTKSDGAILSSPLRGGQEGVGGGQVIAVIELKDTSTTDLDKVEKQAFGYKHRHRDCNYVIISNFQKLRFYINDATEHEEFNLFTLTKERFDVLWLCLQQQYFFNGIALQIKQASVTEEEQVTKKLYSDYSSFRKKLFHNIAKLNPQHDKIELFKRTQKLLDRFLFILFAEDRWLVPANSVRMILDDWKKLKDLDAAQPLYQRFKLYFSFLNTGRDKTNNKEEIFAYNGGLFATDELLDNLQIDDDILFESSVALSNYDFQTEVDVNILGHIFEHSLTEIEELQAEAEGKTIDKTKTKRKKDGVFYTPRYITKYIVENTIGALCKQKKEELQLNEEDYAPLLKKKNQQQLLDKLTAYRHWLLQLTICDPACGSGAFLNQALEFLIAEHRHIDELDAKLGNHSIIYSDVAKSILENNLHGVDINEEAVEIARLSLWLRTAQKGRKLSSLNENIKCGNSLIDDETIAGDKAFNWQKEFPTIFSIKEKQPFHITFVTHYSRRNERMNQYRVPHKEGFWMNEEAELLITGYIKDIVRENNFKVLAYNICGDHVHLMIVAEQAELPEILRKIKGKTSQRFKEHLQLPKEEEFHLWAQKYNTTWLDTPEHYNNAIAYIENNRTKHELPFNKGLQPLVQSMLTNEEAAYAVEYKGGFDVVIGNPPYVLCQPSNTVEKILSYYKTYEVASYKIDLFHLFFEKSIHLTAKNGRIGLITPNTYFANKHIKTLRKFILEKTCVTEILQCEQGVFYDASVDVALIFLSLEKNCRETISIGKMSTNGLVTDRNIIPSLEWKKNEDYVFNIVKKTLATFENCVLLGDIANTYFGIQAFDRKSSISFDIMNENYLPIIDGADIQPFSASYNKIYFNYIPENIKSGGDWEVYSRERIVVRQIGKIPIVGFCEKNILASNTLYSIYPKNDNYHLAFLLCIFNSSVFKLYWEENNSDNKDLFPKIKGYQLKNIPIKITSKESQLPFITKADTMLSTNKELQELKQKILQLLQSNFTTVNINKKLEQWPTLSFADFLKELGKQKIKLSLPQQEEWIPYFEDQKNKAAALQNTINSTDAAIDQMVYQLYELTAEEIAIVEGSH